MKGVKRNLIYWGWMLEKVSFIILVFVVAMWGFMTLMEDGSFTENFTSELWMYLLMGVFIFSFNNAVNGAGTYFPFTISMGSTRKASFLAMQAMQHLILLQYMVLAGVVCYVTERETFRVAAPYVFTIIGAVLFFQAFLNVAAAVWTRFGTAAAVLVYIFACIAVMAIGVLSFQSGSFGNEAFVAELKNIAAKPYFLGISAALDAIAAGVYYSILKKKNMRV